MLGKFEQNRTVQTTQNFEIFENKTKQNKTKPKKKKKKTFFFFLFKPFLTKRWRHFEDVSAAEAIFNA